MDVSGFEFLRIMGLETDPQPLLPQHFTMWQFIISISLTKGVAEATVMFT